MAGLVHLRRSRGGDSPQGAAQGSEGAAEAPAGPGPKIYMETFGCQMNEADTALVLGRLHADGWARVTDPGEADLILVNTCAVREKAEDRV